MHLYQKIKQIIENNFLSEDVNFLTNLAHLAFYRISKETSYFNGTNHLLRLFYSDDGRIRIGHLDLNNVEGFRNNFSAKNLIDLDNLNENIDDFNLVLSDDDNRILHDYKNLLDQAPNYISLSENFNDLLDDSLYKLFHLFYLFGNSMVNGKISLLRYLSVPFNKKSDKELSKNSELFLTHFYATYESIYNDIPNALVTLSQSTLDGSDNTESYFKKHPFYKNHIKFSEEYKKQDLFAKDVINKNLFFKGKILELTFLKSILLSSLENDIFTPYNDGIKTISDFIYNEYPQLINLDVSFNTKIYKKTKQEDGVYSYNYKSDNLFDLGDFDYNIFNGLFVFVDEYFDQDFRTFYEGKDSEAVLFVCSDGLTNSLVAEIWVDNGCCIFKRFEQSNTLSNDKVAKNFFLDVLKYIESNSLSIQFDFYIPDSNTIYSDLLNSFKNTSNLIFLNDLNSPHHFSDEILLFERIMDIDFISDFINKNDILKTKKALELIKNNKDDLKNGLSEDIVFEINRIMKTSTEGA